MARQCTAELWNIEEGEKGKEEQMLQGTWGGVSDKTKRKNEHESSAQKQC